MTRNLSLFGGLTLAACLASGCNNGPPGGGLTNGPPPDLAAEKPAMRTDMPESNRTNTGEMKGAAGTEGSVSAGTATSPTGPAAPGNEPAKDPAPRSGDARKDTVGATGAASAQPPSSGTAPGSAAGATKPSGDIKVGTPKSPQ
jgi:hypothetical protein